MVGKGYFNEKRTNNLKRMEAKTFDIRKMLLANHICQVHGKKTFAFLIMFNVIFMMVVFCAIL